MSRERAVADAFVSIATSLAEGRDVADMLSTLAEDTNRLLDIASTGILLAEPRGALHVIAASSEAVRAVEIFQLQRAEGPCLDCYRSGTPVRVADLGAERTRWPQFVRAAQAEGFRSVHTVPIRSGNTVLGAMGLFGARPGELNEDDLRLGQSLAHVAAVTLTHDAAADGAVFRDRLHRVMDGRVVLEQAKGVLAQHGNLDMGAAFLLLRRYADANGRRLTDVADAVVGRRLTADELVVADPGL